MDARSRIATRSLFDYTASYCEENVWRLAHALGDERAEVVFISNPGRHVAMWQQRAGSSTDEPIFWDYHVILWRPARRGLEVLDLDTLLDFPCSLEAYLAGTFPIADDVVEDYQPWFRVVSAPRFVEVFSSDRLHMKPAGSWVAPPPPWPRIGTGACNLMQFVDMESTFEGTVLSLDDVRARATRRAS